MKTLKKRNTVRPRSNNIFENFINSMLCTEYYCCSSIQALLAEEKKFIFKFPVNIIIPSP